MSEKGDKVEELEMVNERQKAYNKLFENASEREELLETPLVTIIVENDETYPSTVPRSLLERTSRYFQGALKNFAVDQQGIKLYVPECRVYGFINVSTWMREGYITTEDDIWDGESSGDEVLHKTYSGAIMGYIFFLEAAKVLDLVGDFDWVDNLLKGVLVKALGNEYCLNNMPSLINTWILEAADDKDSVHMQSIRMIFAKALVRPYLIWRMGASDTCGTPINPCTCEFFCDLSYAFNKRLAGEVQELALKSFKTLSLAPLGGDGCTSVRLVCPLTEEYFVIPRRLKV